MMLGSQVTNPIVLAQIGFGTCGLRSASVSAKPTSTGCRAPESSNLRSKLADSGAKQPVDVCLAPTVAKRRHGRSMARAACCVAMRKHHKQRKGAFDPIQFHHVYLA